MTYPKPNTSDDYRADAHECIDRAQRSLEVAEINLDGIAGLFNVQNRERSPIAFADLIAAADARVRLGEAWGDLACWKNTVGEPDAAHSTAARVVISAPDDEHVVIEVDGAEVVSANHDAHGWSGMDAVVRAAVAVAEAAGLTVEDGR